MSRNGWGQPACPPATLMSAKNKPAIPSPHGDSTRGFQDVISVHESSYHMEEEKQKLKKKKKKKII